MLTNVNYTTLIWGYLLKPQTALIQSGMVQTTDSVLIKLTC
jgi:hypothetical protein